MPVRVSSPERSVVGVPSSYVRQLSLTALAMLFFAGNSLLCRAALAHTTIDAATFTLIRLASGAAALALLVHFGSRGRLDGAGSWMSALALFAYAAGFSWAYLGLTAATGALLLFGAVQATMFAHGWWAGERLRGLQRLGLAMALAGLVGLLLPGLSAPPLGSGLLMIGAGVAWGIYSVRGRGSGDAIRVTAGNFVRAAPMALLLSLLLLDSARADAAGATLAIASGALASGIGYAIWYTALPGLRSTQAATVQLSVPVLAAIGGVVLLAEPLSPRLVLASVAVLGGIALVIRERSAPPAGPGRG